MKLPDQLIIEKLESLNEHKMAREIFVPLLKKMDLKGVKYVGGSAEHGIDVEYYETSEPDKKRKYTGIQFKKGTALNMEQAETKIPSKRSKTKPRKHSKRKSMALITILKVAFIDLSAP